MYLDISSNRNNCSEHFVCVRMMSARPSMPGCDGSNPAQYLLASCAIECQNIRFMAILFIYIFIEDALH